jgi:hypothetical protein
MTPLQAQAVAELQHKTLEEIQVETAFTWAYRAWAAKQLGLKHDFVEYRHESLEHASLSENDDVLLAVRRIVNDTSI